MAKMKRKSRSALSGWKVLLVVVVGTLLLTGCAVEQEITFYEGERWELVGQMPIPLAMMMPGMEAEFERTIRELQGEVPGVEMSWRQERKDPNMVYHFTASGEGWENLNKVAFEGRAVITRDNGRVSIKYSIPPMGDMMISSLTLHAGEIISSNADEQTATTAIWHRPTGTIEAILIEKAPGMGLLVPLVILGLLVVGGGAAAILVKQGKQKFSEGRAAVTGAVCPQCGTANSSADNFCQSCGAGLKAMVISCPKCGAENPPEVKFCSQCGVEMPHAQ